MRVDQDGRRKRGGLLAVLVVALLMVSACATEEPSQETSGTTAAGDSATTTAEPADTTEAADTTTAEAQTVTLMLPFLESISFFSPLVADEVGYFADEGLDVETSPSDGGSVALQQVISGNQDLGLVSPGLILTAAAEGNQTVVPYTDKHRNLFSVVVPAGSDITAPEQLEGRVLGITDFGGGELPLARAMLERAGLEEGVDIELLVVGEGGPAVATAFEDGAIDAYAASWSDFFPLIQSGLEFEEIVQPELSELPSEVLVATPDFVAEHPDVVEGVSRAMAKASYLTNYDNDTALAILCERIPEECQDPEGARAALELWIGIADVPEEGGEFRFGVHDLEAWETFKEVLGEDMADVDVSAILDDSFIDAANDFDRSEVEAQVDEMDLSFP